MTKKFKVNINESLLKNIIAENIAPQRIAELEKMTGGENVSRSIDYNKVSPAINNASLGIDEDVPSIESLKMKNPPKEMLDFLELFDGALSKLSSVAAKENDEEVKKRLYDVYKKLTLDKVDIIKEFSIVH